MQCKVACMVSWEGTPVLFEAIQALAIPLNVYAPPHKRQVTMLPLGAMQCSQHASMQRASPTQDSGYHSLWLI